MITEQEREKQRREDRIFVARRLDADRKKIMMLYDAFKQAMRGLDEMRRMRYLSGYNFPISGINQSVHILGYDIDDYNASASACASFISSCKPLSIKTEEAFEWEKAIRLLLDKQYFHLNDGTAEGFNISIKQPKPIKVEVPVEVEETEASQDTLQCPRCAGKISVTDNWCRQCGAGFQGKVGDKE
jgi:hypothetical protein